MAYLIISPPLFSVTGVPRGARRGFTALRPAAAGFVRRWGLHPYHVRSSDKPLNVLAAAARTVDGVIVCATKKYLRYFAAFVAFDVVDWHFSLSYIQPQCQMRPPAS